MPTKARYDRMKAERPEVWRHEIEAEQRRQKAKRDRTFSARHPERSVVKACVVCDSQFIPRRRGGTMQRFCSKRCQISDMNRKRRLRFPSRVRESLRLLRARRRAVWLAYLSKQRCSRCGESHPATIEHHHVDRTKKTFNIGAWAGYPWSRVLEELKKCIVLCANCHRKVEWDIRNNGKERG